MAIAQFNTKHLSGLDEFEELPSQSKLDYILNRLKMQNCKDIIIINNNNYMLCGFKSTCTDLNKVILARAWEAHRWWVTLILATSEPWDWNFNNKALNAGLHLTWHRWTNSSGRGPNSSSHLVGQRLSSWRFGSCDKCLKYHHISCN